MLLTTSKTSSFSVTSHQNDLAQSSHVGELIMNSQLFHWQMHASGQDDFFF